MPEPQSRLTVSAGTSTGRPALSATCRAPYKASPLVWSALPKIAWSNSLGSNPDCPTAALAAIAPSSKALKSRRAPPYSPIGVRLPETITMSFILKIILDFCSMHDLLSLLEERVLICDGAMGTMLYTKGVFISRCFDELNISNPHLVREVHADYVAAGADIVETNTFGASRTKLMTHGLAEQAREINLQGVRIAREVAGQDVFVAGAIGPLGIRIEPWGKVAIEEAQGVFREQAQALMDGGVDAFILETFSDLNEVLAAIRGVRDICDLPLIVQMTIEEDGNSTEGTPPEVFAKRLEEWGADVIGLNCSVGPQTMLDAIERIASVTAKKLSVQPNAGKPKNVEGRNIYLSSPEYMASYAKKFVEYGVRIVGGCCGTTPQHIKTMRAAVQGHVSSGVIRDGGKTK